MRLGALSADPAMQPSFSKGHPCQGSECFIPSPTSCHVPEVVDAVLPWVPAMTDPSCSWSRWSRRYALAEQSATIARLERPGQMLAGAFHFISPLIVTRHPV